MKCIKFPIMFYWKTKSYTYMFYLDVYFKIINISNYFFLSSFIMFVETYNRVANRYKKLNITHEPILNKFAHRVIFIN